MLQYKSNKCKLPLPLQAHRIVLKAVGCSKQYLKSVATKEIEEQQQLRKVQRRMIL